MRLYQGKFVYDTVEELTYALMNAMDFSVRSDGVIIDKTIDPAGTIITYMDKMIKVNTDPRQMKYAGEKDILLDPLVNLHIIKRLYGLFLDKVLMEDPTKEVISTYSDEVIDSNNDRITGYGIKFTDGTSFVSEKYYNKTLGLMELIFLISEENVYLRNFDVKPEDMIKLRKLDKEIYNQKIDERRKQAIVVKKVRKPRKKKVEE